VRLSLGKAHTKALRKGVTDYSGHLMGDGRMRGRGSYYFSLHWCASDFSVALTLQITVLKYINNIKILN